MASLIPAAGSTGSGSLTLQGPSTSSTQTVTIPDATGTMMVSGNMPAFRAYAGSNVVISSSTWTKVSLNTKSFDTNSNFDATTNYRFTPTVAGYYQINATANGQTSGTAPTRLVAQIYKNGAAYSYGTDNAVSGTYSSYVSDIIYMNGSTDYIELYVYITATTPTVNSGSSSVYMSGSLVRAA